MMECWVQGWGGGCQHAQNNTPRGWYSRTLEWGAKITRGLISLKFLKTQLFPVIILWQAIQRRGVEATTVTSPPALRASSRCHWFTRTNDAVWNGYLRNCPPCSGPQHFLESLVL